MHVALQTHYLISVQLWLKYAICSGVQMCVCVCVVQVFSSSPWHCVQTPPLETCRRKPWNSITVQTLKWYCVYLTEEKSIYIKNLPVRTVLIPRLLSLTWSHVVLTGVVLVLHRFCLHTDRPALCGWTRSSSGILLRGEYTIRQDAPSTLCGWGCLLYACIVSFKLPNALLKSNLLYADVQIN